MAGLAVSSAQLRAGSRLALAAALCLLTSGSMAQSGSAAGNSGRVFRGNFFGGAGPGVRGGWFLPPGVAGGFGGAGSGRFGPWNIDPGFGLGASSWSWGNRGAGRTWFGNGFNQFGMVSPYGLGYAGWYGYGGGYFGPFAQYGQGSSVPTGPSFANPAPVQPPAEVPAPLDAPAMPASVESTEGRADFSELQARFGSASAKVTSARQLVEEMRSRLASIGQTPRAETLSRLTLAETALSQAQQRLAAGDLVEARNEIRRADYVAQQVLKEFGR